MQQNLPKIPGPEDPTEETSPILLDQPELCANRRHQVVFLLSSKLNSLDLVICYSFWRFFLGRSNYLKQASHSIPLRPYMTNRGGLSLKTRRLNEYKCRR